MSIRRARPEPSTARSTRTGELGFTLIEIIIVLGIIGLLVGLGLPTYKSATVKAKEAVLKENLFILRRLIDQYAQDKGKYPASLQALVQDSYIRAIPIDPMTNQSATWVEVRELPSPEDPMLTEIPGIVDVKSGSESKSPIDGSPYNSW
ncbi:MAG TPA: prepilin-type N-terminal cleavage/methylation domain-containing protein [Candidatus Aminicenantes bacterium]|nr:prepilin-type N-terminal cleavage/methylation domain-containing protein [Candidatus Aminicenantes bacterium]HRY65335.1 prepilin-type N-terminal cleavage/methylation domain-containing protein [Candidatus Aminicenantes bacterium]HRZ72197.1 prepilin-type N-terminal cleavage/methylation domain-containing protein [Candidatus Aminicenantes bacterium]